MTKDLFVFSNPFGFGPTAKALAVIHEGLKIWNVNIHYVTNDSCKEIVNIPNIDIINCDIRNEDAIFNILKNFDNAFVISSINRFAVRCCVKLNIPCAFIDSLTWMWKKIPDDYLLADYYFALNFHGLDEKLKEYPSLIKTPYIIDSCFGEKFYNSDILVNLGGGMNPFIKGLPKSYLKLISSYLNKIDNKKIIVCGGSEVVNYISKANKNPNVICLTIDKMTYMSTLKHTKHLVTVSGLNSSFEAFYYKIPISFLPPTNLSQLKNLNTFINKVKSVSYVNIKNIINETPLNNVDDEKEAILELNSIYDKIFNNTKFKKAFEIEIDKAFNTISNIRLAYDFICELGTEGATTIARKLKKEWSL